MAINRVAYPTTPTPVAGDWAKIVDLMQTNFLLTEGPARIDWDNDNVLKGAIFQVGGVIYLADADTAITGTGSNYVKITASGATASAAYVADLTGVSWSTTYNGYYDVSGNLYVFDELQAIIAGEITGANTRIGQMFEDIIDQDLKTTDDVTFASVNTGQGANELYAMDQAVRTTDDVEFGSVNITSLGSRTKTTDNTEFNYVIPEGVYYLKVVPSVGDNTSLQVRDSTSSWINITPTSTDTFSLIVISDGTNVQINSLGSFAYTLIEIGS